VAAAYDLAGALGDRSAIASAPRIGATELTPAGGVALVNRPTEQANLVLGMPGIPRTDDRRFALGVLNSALGGGMSSRLFQEVREKRGLAYSVYSFASHYADLGMFGVYAGCQPGRVDQVLEICKAELAKVAEQGISSEELTRGIGQLRGSLVLGLEDTGSRMSRLGKSELVYGELLSVEDILDKIGAVTLEDVRSLANELLVAEPTLAVIGPFEDDSAFRSGASTGSGTLAPAADSSAPAADSSAPAADSSAPAAAGPSG